MVFTRFLPETHQINHQIRFSPLSLVLAEESLDYCSLALMAPVAPVAPDDHNIHGFFGLLGYLGLFGIFWIIWDCWDNLELSNCLFVPVEIGFTARDNMYEPCGYFVSFQISVLPGWVKTGDPRSQMVLDLRALTWAVMIADLWRGRQMYLTMGYIPQKAISIGTWWWWWWIKPMELGYTIFNPCASKSSWSSVRRCNEYRPATSQSFHSEHLSPSNQT